VLATRYRAAAVFLGAALALSVQSLIAVSAGQLFSLLPARPVQLATGLVFLVSAVFLWRRKQDGDEGGQKGAADRRGFWGQLGSTFAVIFIAEWGDLTQVGTAALAARYRQPFTVGIAATLALWCVVALAVFLGGRLGQVLKPALMQKVAAVVFAAVGIALLVGQR